MFIYQVEIKDEDDNNFNYREHHVSEQSAIFSAIENMIGIMSSWTESILTSEEVKIYNNIVNLVNLRKYTEALDMYNDIPFLLGEDGDGHVIITVDKIPLIDISRMRKTINRIERDNACALQTNEVVKCQEEPCIHCGRMNDVGVIECWNCGSSPH